LEKESFLKVSLPARNRYHEHGESSEEDSEGGSEAQGRTKDREAASKGCQSKEGETCYAEKGEPCGGSETIVDAGCSGAFLLCISDHSGCFSLSIFAYFIEKKWQVKHDTPKLRPVSRNAKK
jgi:hypothetical protein